MNESARRGVCVVVMESTNACVKRFYFEERLNEFAFRKSYLHDENDHILFVVTCTKGNTLNKYFKKNI